VHVKRTKKKLRQQHQQIPTHPRQLHQRPGIKWQKTRQRPHPLQRQQTNKAPQRLPRRHCQDHNDRLHQRIPLHPRLNHHHPQLRIKSPRNQKGSLKKHQNGRV